MDIRSIIFRPEALFCCLTRQGKLIRKCNYSKIPILRPPLGLSKSGLKYHFWTAPRVVSNQRYTV